MVHRHSIYSHAKQKSVKCWSISKLFTWEWSGSATWTTTFPVCYFNTEPGTPNSPTWHVIWPTFKGIPFCKQVLQAKEEPEFSESSKMHHTEDKLPKLWPVGGGRGNQTPTHTIICNDCSNQFITQINYSWTYELQGSSWVFKYTQVCQMNFYPYIQKDLSS